MTEADFTSSSGQNGEGGAQEEQTQVMLLPHSKVAWLQEVAFTVTKLLIVVVTCLVAILSILARAQWYDILIRTAVTILSLGFLGWLINWFLGRYLVEAKLMELEEEKMREEQEAQTAEESQQPDVADEESEPSMVKVEA
ncbi:MAG: hypothetical protein HPY45_01545 [Anaerolineae bacterium]|nr:hypothetical protein [Anaerolineae bacterium]